MKPEKISSTDYKLLQKKYPNQMEEIKSKLQNHYPVQYLIGDVEFLNTTIKVDERVLIPRFETELLVQKTIDQIRILRLEYPKVLELGTGSGCISIALKKNIDCEVTALDISKPALTLARENAILNETNINFIEEDMLDVSYNGFDVLISNPPYVAKEEVVDEEIKYEPEEAIYAKNNGLYYYQEIIKKISLEKPDLKLIAFEIGMNQGEELQKLSETYLPDYFFLMEQDLTNRNRYVFLVQKRFFYDIIGTGEKKCEEQQKKS